MAGIRVKISGIWGSPKFDLGSFRDPNALVARLREKADVVSSYLNDRMDLVTKEHLDSFQRSGGESTSLRAVLADHFNTVISGISLCGISGFQTVKLKFETEKLRRQNPQGQDLIQLNRMILDDVYSQEIWWMRSWQPNAELCHPCHELPIDRFELIHDTKFTDIAVETGRHIVFVSPSTNVRYHKINWEDPWDVDKVYSALDHWAQNYPFDCGCERYFVHTVRGSDTQKICMFLLVESNRIPGMLLQNSPPENGMPHGKVTLVDLDDPKYDQIAARFQRPLNDAVSILKQGIETRNAEFNSLIEEIERVAVNTTKPILLLGPTGAGKSELAKRIFALRKERGVLKGDFIEVNCGTIRGDTVSSELFGHKKGAFTGATEDHTGLVLAAHNGMLFLDEIGDLSLQNQSLLLRAIEKKQFRPVGAVKEECSDFQLITATNRDLSAAVRNKAFRADFLARIDLWSYELPGLRDRPEDIEPNLDYELRRLTEEKRKRIRMNREVRHSFLRFATSPDAKWTSNFRDFIRILDRMATLSDGGNITRSVLEKQIDWLNQKWSEEEDMNSVNPAILRSVLTEDELAKMDAIDRIQLADVLQVCRESKTAAEAGRKLYTSPGHTNANFSDLLSKYLNRFGLHFSACAKLAGLKV